ncbi:MAG: serine/threonine protein kinase, partial [Planctomycetes bacterium]|nr:serine/threonine protein kinase [Planctomycetota bacterium]
MSSLGSAPDPPRADALGPRFEVRGELGRGGMGIVYRAFDRQLGREVAVKLILNATGQRMQRLEREGQSLANLSHSGIVRVHEGGEHGGQPFLVCELVEGARTLDRVLPELSLRARLERVRDAAAALGAAHTVGVVHRDVKPENLLIDAGGRLFVTDFGLALVAGASRLTHTGALLGTPHYMSPEQVLGQRESQGPPSDVWSLGVVLYLALTDALPFEGENLGTLGYSIANDPAPAPSSRAPGLDRALDAICARALEKDPAQRYPHGGALAADLDAYLAGEGHAAGGGLRLAALSACGLLGLLGAL